MNEFLRDHIGEIALLIYILYPLLKRWWDRRKKARTRTETRTEAPAEAKPTGRARPRPSPGPRERVMEPPARPEPPPPQEPSLVAAARANVERLQVEATRMLDQARANPRLQWLVPALQEDLLERLQEVDRSLRGSPTVSTLVQETAVVRGLEDLTRHLRRISHQRLAAPRGVFSYADAMVQACYAPLLDFARAQGLDLSTREPVAVMGDWNRALTLRFASTRVAPIQLPPDFETSLWQWPSIGREVARDFLYSVDRLEDEIEARLGLPSEVAVPESDGEIDARWLAGLFGPWLPELFVDVMGTLMLGPAYVEMIRREYRNPSAPQRTAAILQDGVRIDDQPPPRLRMHAVVRVLHHLGRHEEADASWARWEADHPDVSLYFLPLGGRWAGLSEEALHSAADSFVDTLIQRPWPELEGFQLMNIPGFPYLHADHAEVERLATGLRRGDVVDADPRWIVAAAVVAASAQPALHDSILDAARRAIGGMVREETRPSFRPLRPRPSRSVSAALLSSLRDPQAIREAIALNAALGAKRTR